MQKSFPFLSDTMIPRIGEKRPVNHRNSQAFVYPMSQFPTPQTMCVGGVIVPVEVTQIYYQYFFGTATVEMYPNRDTSKAILDALEANSKLDCPEPLPKGERVCIAFLRGFLWFCMESDAREMGAKSYSEWYNAGIKTEVPELMPQGAVEPICQN